MEACGRVRAVGTWQADRLSERQGQSHTAQNRPLLEALADVVDRQTGVIGYQAWPALRCRRVRVLGGAFRAARRLACLAHQIRSNSPFAVTQEPPAAGSPSFGPASVAFPSPGCVSPAVPPHLVSSFVSTATTIAPLGSAS